MLRKCTLFMALLAHLSTKCSEWAIVITHRPSAPVVCLSVCLSIVRSHFLVYTLASTNINQSAPNLVQMYMTIRSRMSLIMELIGPQLSELSALELKKLPFFNLVTLLHLKYWPISTKLGHNVIMYVPLRSRMSLIVGLYHLQILTNQYQTWSKCIWP